MFNGSRNPGISAFQGASNVQLNGSTVTNVGGNIYNNIHHNYSRPAVVDERIEIANWLSPISFRAFLQDNLEWHTPHTRMDYIKSDYFSQWFESQRKALWGTGMPGAGKTMLASVVIEILEEREAQVSPGTMSVTFIYCRYTERLSLREILAAVVKQNLLKHPELLPLVKSLYAKHIAEGTAPTRQELTALLKEFARRFRINFYFLDGLDEALEEVRLELLKILAALGVNLMVTSRPLKGLHYLLPAARHFDVVALKGDLRLMIVQKIEHNSELRDLLESRPEVLDELISLIYEKAGGMFLHAYLQVQALDGCTTVKEARDAVNAFPQSVQAMYSLSVKRIKEQKRFQVTLALRILHWLVYAQGSLKVEDMRYALATSFEPGGYHYDEDNAPHENSIVSVCCGLVTIQPSSRTVRLVHYTARDALRSLWGSELYPSNPNPHSILACICVGRLVASGFSNRPDLLQYNQLAGEFQQSPLLQYAYYHWDYHALQCIHLHHDPATPTVREFLLQCKAYPQPLESEVDHLKPIHVAARYDFRGLLSQSPDINTCQMPTRLGQTSLMLACRGGHFSFMKEVLETAGDVINAQDAHGHTALIWASVRGYEDIVAELLRFPDINVNAADSDGHSAFSYACDRGQVGAMDLLLQHPKVNISHQDQSGQTPLMLALWKGENGVVVVDRLLRHLRTTGGGPAQNTWPGYQELRLAIFQGDENLVHRLVQEFAIDVNWTDTEGKSLRDLAREWEEIDETIAAAFRHAFEMD